MLLWKEVGLEVVTKQGCSVGMAIFLQVCSRISIFFNGFLVIRMANWTYYL